MSFVRNRREHSVRIAELGGSLENFGMVQQRAIEHARELSTTRRSSM